MGEVNTPDDSRAARPPSVPEITVVMPNYNGAQFIARSIASALGQSFDSIELLVVDDGSHDDSVAVVTAISDSRLRLIRRSHEGVCAARNQGIEQAAGTYIAFLDSDDTWEPDCLAKLHAALGESRKAAVAYCGWRNVGTGAVRGAPFVPPDYEVPDKLELCIRNTRWPIHAALTRKEAIVVAGGFDPRFPTSEDFLLWLKIVAENAVVRVPEVLASYHHHGGPRATANRVRMAFNHLGAQLAFLQHRPSVVSTLGRSKIRELTLGELLRRGYECYWQNDLDGARQIFRRVMQSGYGSPSDWKSMLPALLPLGFHALLLGSRGDRGKGGTSHGTFASGAADGDGKTAGSTDMPAGDGR